MKEIIEMIIGLNSIQYNHKLSGSLWQLHIYLPCLELF